MDKYELTKYGSFWTVLKSNKDLKNNLLKAVVAGSVGLSLVAAGAAADQILEALRERGRPKKSRKYFVKMLENYPELKGKDPKLIARFWDSLFHFSPHMAKDPLAAGAFIQQNIERGFLDQYGGPPPDTYQAIADIQDKHEKHKSKGLFLPAFVKEIPNILKDLDKSELGPQNLNFI